MCSGPVRHACLIFFFFFLVQLHLVEKFSPASDEVPIFLTEVNCGECAGTCQGLLDCASPPLGKHRCTHAMDVGVHCEGTVYMYIDGGWKGENMTKEQKQKKVHSGNRTVYLSRPVGCVT